ncbi:CdaR family protein [Deinococcus sp.]|uniref:CdaR family protein n=1 Tax=Deinococcus sp. TaxID=47478 RepID=UPI0025C49D3F|nr:CdaR family protein [Deinococcus sp.]
MNRESGMNRESQPTWAAEVRRWLHPSYVWKRLRHNFWPKMLSLAIAVVLWLVTTADRRANVEQGFDVPITIHDTTGGSERRAVSNLSAETVRVTLSARPDRLRELTAAKIEAMVDVTNLPEGNFNRRVTVTVPSDTALARKAPDSVQGFIDTQLSRTLPITVSVATPPENSLPRYTVVPSEASVGGPSRVVSAVKTLIVSPVSLEPGDDREVNLIALDSGGKPVENVEIRPASVTLRRIDNGSVPVKALRVTLNDPPANLKVTAQSLQPSTVRVVAAPELLGRLQEVAGNVTYHAGTYTAPVQLQLPAGVQALEEVAVRLTVTPTARAK